MTLIETLNKSDFKDVWIYLISEYEDHDNENSLISYIEVFEKLKTIEPIKSDVKIRIKYVEHKHYTGWCVDGINEESTYAIEFRPWNEWLGMELEEETLNHYKPHEIIAHCLWEMTFIGYDEGKIQNEFNELTKRVEEVKQELEKPANG